MPLGTEVQVDLHLPSASEMLPLRAKVARIVDDDASRARKASGMGLAVDLSQEPVRSRFSALLTQHHLPVNLPPAAVAVPVPAPPANGRHTAAIAIPLPGPSSAPAATDRASLPPADEENLSKAASNGSSLPSDWPASWADLVKDAPRPADNKAAPFPFARPEPVANAAPPSVPLPGPTPIAPVVPAAPAVAPPAVAPPVAAAAPVFQPPPAPVAAPPPAPVPAVDTRALEARMRELEKSLAEARELAMRAESARETSAAEHETVVKRLYEEIASVRAQKISAPVAASAAAAPAQASKRSPALPALFGLVIGAAAVVAVLLFVPDVRALLGVQSGSVAQPAPVAITQPPAQVPAAIAEAKPAVEPVSEAEPDVELEPLTEAAPIAEVTPEPVAEAKPEPVAEVKPEPVAEVKPEPVAVVEAKPEPEPVAEAKPEPTPEPVAVVEAKPEPKPVPKPVVKPASTVQPATYGKLNLRADYPATVYVNGRRVGKTPLSGLKTKSGKLYVRFDCVVEDTLMRGKARAVNLDEDGVVTLDHACVK